MNERMFNSDVELSKFLGCIDVIQYAFRAISDTTLAYELHPSPSGTKVLAFNCPPDYITPFLNGELDLVSSENNEVVDFISTKVNSKFLINKAAVELFENLSDDLKEVEKNHRNTPLVITGSGLGGYLAILSALRLHRAVDEEESNGSKNTKRPVCFTFGSPLLGDADLQRAISERPQWKSSFLNVVAKKDPVASFFGSKTPYKPFGTTLFCTDSGGHSAFEDEEAILAALDAMASSNAGNREIYDYGNVWSLMRKKVLYRGVIELGEFNSNSLKAGITLQFKEVGALDDISNDLIAKMEGRKTKMIKSKKNPYDPTKTLNEMKISLTYMEWYMKSMKPKGGYYDCYRKKEIPKDESDRIQVIVLNHVKLKNYWKKFVEEKDRLPQKEGAKLRKRWLYGGTNYRRIVEPLEIAKYYKDGKTNYISNRENHYKLLERWADEDRDSNPVKGKKNKAASLTEDSCFWAYVEEALILLSNGGSSNNADENEKKLEQFEAYAMRSINNYSVSPDIFLEGSSFMKWWNEYKAHKGTSYDSEFFQYMGNKRHELYQ